MADSDGYRVGLPRALRVPRNLAGVLGVAVCVGSTISFAFLVVVELSLGPANPYVGLFTYLVVPLLGVLGLALWMFGRWCRNRAVACGLAAPSYTLLDLTKVRNQQSMLLLTAAVAGALVFLMSVGGVRAIQYTESEAFCGDVCHTVMQPEAVAHQLAPHAAVKCVDCHVGSGVTSYVQAKVRGIRQVLGVALGSYPRPIPTPIHMRSSAETCQECHWREYNREKKPLSRRYYLTEGFDGPWVLEMSLRLGGGTFESGYSDGAHWHNNADSRIEYIATDDKLQEIAWIGFTDRDGTVTEYRNRDLEFDEALITGGVRHAFECMTCHNRPAHAFVPPTEALNREFRIGTLAPDVPGLRPLALEILAADYESSAAAMLEIDRSLRVGIAAEEPEWPDDHPAQLDSTIAVVQRIFRSSQFPAMNVRWSEYPDNKKHWNSPGCFRCHAGNMASSAGGEVSSACDTCHVILGQGRLGESWQYDPAGLAFVHPADDEVMEAPVLCHECHDGSLGY